MENGALDREYEELRFCSTALPRESVYESDKLTIKRICYGEDETDCLVKIYRSRDLSATFGVLKEITARYPWCGLGRVYDECCMFGDTYVIEERVQGHSLRREIELRTERSGSDSPKGLFSEKEVIGIGIALCNAASLLHEYRVIHRDIKPENIVMQTDGAVKLIDFDISRIVKNSGQLQDTRLAATLMYAPPEQSSRTGEVTREAADIYSIGAVLYELLYGPASEDTMFRRDRRDSVLFPEKRRINTVLRKCLAFRPSDRYESAGQLKRNLLRAADYDNRAYFDFFLMQFLVYNCLGLTFVSLLVLLLGRAYPYVERWAAPFIKPEEAVLMEYLAGLVTRRLKPIAVFAFAMFDIAVTVLLPHLTNREGVPANWRYIKQMLSFHCVAIGMYMALLSSGFAVWMLLFAGAVIVGLGALAYVRNTKTIDEIDLGSGENGYAGSHYSR